MRTLVQFLVLAMPALATDSTEAAVAKVLREVLLKKLPSPAIDTKHNWGHQKEVVTGYDVKRRGRLDWERTPITELRNDGHWTHAVVTLKDPAKTLGFEIEDLKPAANGAIAFTAKLSAKDVYLKFEQQVWARGVRTFSNETRATCQAAVHLQCELSQRLEPVPGSSFPVMVLKLHVAKAELFYDHLIVEHTLGLGGDAAKLIGDATHKLITRIKPSLEKDLIAKANAEIVKATNEKEVKLSLASLLKK